MHAAAWDLFFYFPFFFKTYILLTANLLRQEKEASRLELFEVFKDVSHPETISI